MPYLFVEDRQWHPKRLSLRVPLHERVQEYDWAYFQSAIFAAGLPYRVAHRVIFPNPWQTGVYALYRQESTPCISPHQFYHPA